MAETSYLTVRRAGTLLRFLPQRFSALGHKHDASDVATGVMEPARLPYATADEAASYFGTGAVVAPGAYNVAVATLDEALTYLREI